MAQGGAVIHWFWTGREKAFLRREAADGATIEEVAENLGRTRGGVQYMAQLLGVHFRKGRRPDMTKRLRLLELVGDGVPMRQIALTLCISLGTVSAMTASLKRLGLLRRAGRRLVVVKEAS